MDINLEQSLRSIDNFNFHHMGRIQDNFNLDGMIIIESYLLFIYLFIYLLMCYDFKSLYLMIEFFGRFVSPTLNILLPASARSGQPFAKTNLP